MFIVTIKMQMLGLCGVACAAQRCGSRLITSRIMHQNVTCWRWQCVCVVVSWWINHLIAVVYSDLFTQLLWSLPPNNKCPTID